LSEVPVERRLQAAFELMTWGNVGEWNDLYTAAKYPSEKVYYIAA
jgi:hypothetical protein